MSSPVLGVCGATRIPPAVAALGSAPRAAAQGKEEADAGAARARRAQARG
jgi:hypothetical protein